MVQFFLFLVILFLAGCSGPEEFDLERKTPVTGVCKSCRPYFVRGEWHYPQKHYEYKKIGLASWYGPGFHGKQKANGEIFNQHHLTAAHRTLPLPSVVRVINNHTGQSLDIVITDRGPFVYEGRIIDLSFQCAKNLGVYRNGLTEVTVITLVKQSKALSNYLKKNGTGGRTWRQVYDEEIRDNFPEDSQDYENDDSFNIQQVAVKPSSPPKENTTHEEFDLEKFVDTLSPKQKKADIKLLSAIPKPIKKTSKKSRNSMRRI